MKKLLIFILLLVLSACNESIPTTTTEPDDRRLIINSYTIEVDEIAQINVKFINMEKEEVTYTYEGNDIWINNGKVKGMLSNTQTVVTATSKSNVSTTFKVIVKEDNYESKMPQEVTEGWLNPITINPISNLEDDFPLGIDMSMVYEVVKNGGKYYNQEGRRQNVFQIIKNAGVNYVRLRIWNNPYNTYTNGDKVSYGGGTCDLDNMLILASEAKAMGLKLLLDFHYSDFWADPSYQVIPKAWASCKTSDELAKTLKEYTKDVLLKLKERNALPDMVQIGNEVTNGMLTRYPGAEEDRLTGDNNALYLTQSYVLDSSLRGYAFSSNFRKYLKAGLDACKEVDDSILKMIHISKGMTGTDFMKKFYTDILELDFDIIGLSYYPRYQGKVSDLKKALEFLNKEFPDKLVTIAETSYAYTYASSNYASNSFNTEWAITNYDVSVNGQAQFVRDVIDTLASSPNGYGIFYWEGAWLPVNGAGWADSLTRCTWANQTFFTYNGMMLPSLNVFKEIKK